MKGMLYNAEVEVKGLIIFLLTDLGFSIILSIFKAYGIYFDTTVPLISQGYG